MTLQLPLGITLKPSVDFASFVAGRNGEAVSRLRTPLDPFLYLWGESGSGKSHLLQAACQQAQTGDRQPAYLPLRDEQGLEPGMLEGLEEFALVCLDDLESVAGDAAWEGVITSYSIHYTKLYDSLRPGRAAALPGSYPGSDRKKRCRGPG